MIKRISLLVTAALLVATMAMAGLAAPAFAVNTCKDGEFQERTQPPFGQQEFSCQKGSTTNTVEKHGRGDGQGNTQEECFKTTGQGPREVECR